MKKYSFLQVEVFSGFILIFLAIISMMLERGAPTINASSEIFQAFSQKYSFELLLQSFFFITSLGVYIFFINALKSFFSRYEKIPGLFSSIILSSGSIYIGLNFIFQCVQITMSLSTNIATSIIPTLSILGYSISVIANIPFAVMLIAISLTFFSNKSLPLWIGIFTLIIALINILMVTGLLFKDSIFSPGAIVSYISYSLIPIWIITITLFMLAKLKNG